MWGEVKPENLQAAGRALSNPWLHREARCRSTKANKLSIERLDKSYKAGGRLLLVGMEIRDGGYNNVVTACRSHFDHRIYRRAIQKIPSVLPPHLEKAAQAGSHDIVMMLPKFGTSL